MNLTEFFFANYVGEYRFKTEKERELTTKAIEYVSQMIDSSVPFDSTIMQVGIDIFQVMANQGFVSIKTIPFSVFKARNTLVEEDVFYYHPVLQMKPRMPVFDETTLCVVDSSDENYLEIRKLFTLNQCLSYIYKKTNTSIAFMDINRDTGAIQHIHKKYMNIKPSLYGIAFLDFLLFLADIAAEKKQRVTSLLSLYDNVDLAAEKAKCITEIAKSYGYDHEVFRDEAVYEKYGR